MLDHVRFPFPRYPGTESESAPESCACCMAVPATVEVTEDRPVGAAAIGDVVCADCARSAGVA